MYRHRIPTQLVRVLLRLLPTGLLDQGETLLRHRRLRSRTELHSFQGSLPNNLGCLILLRGGDGQHVERALAHPLLDLAPLLR